MLKILTYIYSILEKKQKKVFWYILLLSFIAMVFEALGILSFMSFLNLFSDLEQTIFVQKFKSFLGINNNDLIFVFLLIISLIFIFKTIFLIYYTKIKTLFIEEVKVDQSNNLFFYYLNKPLSFHINKSSSELIRDLNEAQALGLIVRVLVELMLEFIVLIGIIIFLLNLNFAFTTSSILIFLFFSTLFYFFIGKKAQKWGEARKDSAGIRLKKIQQGFSAIRDIKILNKEKFFSESFSKINQEESNNHYKHSFFSSMPKMLFELICIIIILAILYYIYFEKKNIIYFLPEMSAYALAAYRLMPSIVKILNADQSLKYWFPITKPYIEKSISFRNKIVNFSSVGHDLEIKNINFLKQEKYNIEFKGVNFNFNNSDNFFLKNINLEIKNNDLIGIYGESGSGKTTFLHLLLGFYEPNEGQILFGGKNIYKDTESWRKLLSFIPQNVYILDETVIKNVAFGHKEENIDIEKVKYSLKKANIYEFVNSSENKLYTNCGELGEFLSGGQRQRIAIARAFYNDSKILVFDEFTNFLDSDNEKKIMNEIVNLKQKTRIIVSHKKSTLNFCNKLFEIKDNTIIEKF